MIEVKKLQMPAGLRAVVAGLLFGAVSATPVMAMPGDATEWGARDPGACPAIRLAAAPTSAQVTTMLRCRHETIERAGGALWLMENLNVAVGAPIPFVAAYNSFVMREADTRSQVYPIRGSWTWSVCMTRHDAGIRGNPDQNCYETDVQAAKGVCWKTSFGDWSCLLSGSSFGRRENTRPPRRGAPGQAR